MIIKERNEQCCNLQKVDAILETYMLVVGSCISTLSECKLDPAYFDQEQDTAKHNVKEVKEMCASNEKYVKRTKSPNQDHFKRVYAKINRSNLLMHR